MLAYAYFYCAAYTRMKVNESSTNSGQEVALQKSYRSKAKPKEMCFQASSKCRSVLNRCNVTRQTVP